MGRRSTRLEATEDPCSQLQAPSSQLPNASDPAIPPQSSPPPRAASVEDHRLVAIDQHPAFQVPPHRLGQHQPLEIAALAH